MQDMDVNHSKHHSRHSGMLVNLDSKHNQKWKLKSPTHVISHLLACRPGLARNRYLNVREGKRKFPSQWPATPHIKPLLISKPLSPIFNFVKTENGWRLITAHSADRWRQ